MGILSRAFSQPAYFENSPQQKLGAIMIIPEISRTVSY